MENSAKSREILTNTAILQEAWQKLYGFKKSFWGGVAIIGCALLLLSLVLWPVDLLLKFISSGSIQLGFAQVASPEGKTSVFDLPWLFVMLSIGLAIIERIVRALVSFPLVAGLWMLAIRRSMEESTKSQYVLAYYSKAKNLLFGQLWIMFLMMAILWCGLFLPSLFLKGDDEFNKMVLGIATIVSVCYALYIMFSYFWFIPLTAQRELGVWQALSLSRQAFKHYRLKFAGLYIMLTIPLLTAMLATSIISVPMTALMGLLGVSTNTSSVLLSIGSIIGFIVGAVWYLPWCKLAGATLYREVFADFAVDSKSSAATEND